MQFVSTRNAKNRVKFSQVITNCIPNDGGMYVPAYEENIRPWINHMSENTSFTSIAGSLTSALLKEEFSPIVSEAIATSAFTFSPQLRRLHDHLYTLELFHGPTGSHKDFGVSYLASCLEHILLMQDKTAIVLAVTAGETGSCIAHAFKNKKRLKAVLLYPKGTMQGLSETDYIWNGGNMYPVEIDGTLKDCHRLARSIYEDHSLIESYGLTLANTVNIGRLFPQLFFYTYAFLRLRKKVYGDIYYALTAGNYGNLVGGLYSWKFSLPVNGFITDCSPELCIDEYGKCMVPDTDIPLIKRSRTDLATPSNLERLEEVFFTSPSVLRGLVFPANVSADDQASALRELRTKYGLFVDPDTARAYAATKKRKAMLYEDEGSIVLVSRYNPALCASEIMRVCGESPELPENLAALTSPILPVKTARAEKGDILRILSDIKPLP